MEARAENVVQNIGAIAETVSIFYNSIVKQVPKDAALILTQHFMDITIARRTATPAQLAQAAALAEAQRRAAERRRQQEQKNEDPSAAPQEPTQAPQPPEASEE